MANPQNFSAPASPALVRALFSDIARRYDLINDLQSFGLHRRWKDQVVRLAQVRPGGRALDVCCGTGDIAFRLARAGATTVGLDFSEPMLQVAAERQREAGAAVEFMHGDAMNLPFAPGQFEIVTIGYGLRNLPEVAGGLRELARVLQPGGRAVILDFARPRQPLWRALYFAYLRAVVPLFGRTFCGSTAAYAYILESLRRYPDAEVITATMIQAGFARVECRELLGGVMTIHVGWKPS